MRTVNGCSRPRLIIVDLDSNLFLFDLTFRARDEDITSRSFVDDGERSTKARSSRAENKI